MIDFLCMAGQMRSGKNVAGDYFCDRLGFRLASFAKPVKDIFCNAFGTDMDFIESWKIEKEPPPGFTKPVRQALQFIGDGFRSIHPDVWVDYAFSHSPPKSCFTDGRYINELSKVKSEGGINILLWRPGHENDDPNESEAQIKRIVDWFISGYGTSSRILEVSFDAPKGCELIDFFIVNDGTIASLHEKLDSLVLPHVQT